MVSSEILLYFSKNTSEFPDGGENGFLCDSAQRFDKIIQGIRAGKYNWRKIAQNARETVIQKFTAEQMSDSYKALYKKILNGGL